MTNGVLLVGDVHLTDPTRKPTGRTSLYTEEILAKLQFCVDTANKLSVPLVQAGDMFHLKTPSRTSHSLVSSVHDILEQTNNGVWIVPGNHDMQGDRLDSLDRQPLGVLARMSNVRLLLGEDPDLPDVAGIPYLPTFDQGNLYWPEDLRYNPFDIDTPSLIVTHAPFFPPGQEPEVYNHMSLDLWADIHLGIPGTYYGHIHECHGTFTDKNGYMQFCNQGSLSRGSLHASSINHQPAITLWKDNEFTRIEVPHKPAEEVFLFEEAKLKKALQASSKEFVESFANPIQPMTLENFTADLRNRASSDTVFKLIEDSLDQAQS